ncbi:MAG: carotenoid 1,2-hydratase [Verrucomicrobiae bacterium]|nr:carotenoid 1,2-hydratase [Verrucomicrobiae bacterium]
MSLTVTGKPRWSRPPGGLWMLALTALLSGSGIARAAGPLDFALPQPGRAFSFPRDHGSHPEFALEWWYVTGELQEPDGVRHGFQATFFRRANPLGPDAGAPATASFGDAHLYLAHMAFLDGASGTFLHEERLNREGWDAGASVQTLNLRNGNWFLRMAPEGGEDPSRPVLELQGGIRADVAFRLTLTPRKPLVVFGTNGVSRKAAEPWAASHYLTFPRLAVTGTLKLQGRDRVVHGEAWMDHEYSSSQLGAGQVGWDWAGIRLNDGREVMAYRLRRDDGTSDPFSTLAWVDAGGAVRHLDATQFRWVTEGQWRSPATGAVYPARVRLETRDPESGAPLVLQLVPVRAAQELTGGLGGIAYWDGACRVLDAAGRELGNAFLEMTGYAASLAGRL